MLVVAGVLAGWVLLSVGYQIFPEALGRIRHFDLFGFIPNYKFFAPDPIHYDLVLLVRFAEDGRAHDGAADRAFGEWRDVEAVCVREPYFWLFNPHRRLYKSISDLFTALVRLGDDYDSAALSRSTPACAIADYLRQSLHTGTMAALPAEGRGRPGTVQFAIACVEDARRTPHSSLAFVSQPFPLSLERGVGGR